MESALEGLDPGRIGPVESALAVLGLGVYGPGALDLVAIALLVLDPAVLDLEALDLVAIALAVLGLGDTGQEGIDPEELGLYVVLDLEGIALEEQSGLAEDEPAQEEQNQAKQAV